MAQKKSIKCNNYISIIHVRILYISETQERAPCPVNTDNRGTTWKETLPSQTVTLTCQEADSTGTIV